MLTRSDGMGASLTPNKWFLQEMVLGIDCLKQAIRDRMSNRQLVSLAERRAGVDNIAAFGSGGSLKPLTWQTLGGVRAAKFQPRQASGTGMVIYAHGGAFVAGSPHSHQVLCENIARYAGVPVLSIAYRLAPEHPHPAAVDDLTAVYQALLDQGSDPSRLVLAGDSAGATIALLALCRLRDDGRTMPKAAVMISPLYDFTCSSSTYADMATVDPFITRTGLVEDINQYLCDGVASIDDLQKTLGNLTGLPPLLIQVGSDEVLLGDAEMLAQNAGRAGVPVVLEVWPHMSHVWHLFPAYVDEALEASRAIGRFIEQALAK